MSLSINSKNSDATVALGESLGRNLRGGEIIELISDVGGGKTTFAQGLARGAGSTDRVASPTFTVSKEYSCPKFTIYHFDFYRLSDPGIVKLELAELLEDETAVIVVEWANIVEDILLGSIKIEFCRIKESEDGRDIKISIPSARGYLLKGLR